MRLKWTCNVDGKEMVVADYLIGTDRFDIFPASITLPSPLGGDRTDRFMLGVNADIRITLTDDHLRSKAF